MKFLIDANLPYKLALFDTHFDKIIVLFENYDLVELDNKQIIVHEK
jgi:hypothetical protein